jgi:hypothetical protein
MIKSFYFKKNSTSLEKTIIMPIGATFGGKELRLLHGKPIKTVRPTRTQKHHHE